MSNASVGVKGSRWLGGRGDLFGIRHVERGGKKGKKNSRKLQRLRGAKKNFLRVRTEGEEGKEFCSRKVAESCRTRIYETGKGRHDSLVGQKGRGTQRRTNSTRTDLKKKNEEEALIDLSKPSCDRGNNTRGFYDPSGKADSFGETREKARNEGRGTLLQKLQL